MIDKALLPTSLTILVVDKDDDQQSFVQRVLLPLEAGVRIISVNRLKTAVAAVRDTTVACIITELELPDASGVRAVRALRAAAPDVPVIVATILPRVDLAVAAMKQGAADYLVKGLDASARMPAAVREAVGQAVLAGLDDPSEVGPMARLCADRESFIATTPGMRRVLGLVERAANSAVPVLLEGETGTGKEVLARAIHERGNRRGSPFLIQNCAALAESLLESELFGHVRGAFTGAERDRRGLFDEAGEGTVFLDEIGDAPLSVQAKLLRVLQNQEVKPVGADRSHRVRARVVAATNRLLGADVRAGRFREDLFFRLSAFPIRIPPLRHRAADVAPIAETVLRRLEVEEGRPTGGIDPAAMRMLQAYRWPGNVRELEHEIHRLVLTIPAGERIRPKHLAPRIRAHGVAMPVEPLVLTLARIELALINDRLRCCVSKTAAAKSLGITREALYAKLRRLGHITMSDAGESEHQQ